MPRVVARLSANNELRLDFQECVSKRKPTDNAEKQKLERIGDDLQWLLYLNRTLENFPNSPKVPVVQENSCQWLDREQVRLKVKLLQERLAIPLDLMKKSQDGNSDEKTELMPLTQDALGVSVPRHSSWGKEQSVKRFSKCGRHTLLEAGAVFDLDPYLKRLGRGYIVTLTIPGDKPEIFKIISDWSGYIWNRMIQCVRDYEKQDEIAEIYWFRVWELQKRGALHLHIYVNANSTVLAEEISHKLKDAWYKTCDDICSKHGVDFFVNKWGKSWRNHPDKWQWDIQLVKKSVGAYFSKYASKGNRQVDKPNDCKTPIYYPSRWWSVSKSVREYIEDYRVKVEFNYANHAELVEILCTLSQWTNDARVSLHREYCVRDDERVLCSGERFTWYFNPDTWLSVHHRIYTDCLEFYSVCESLIRQLKSKKESRVFKREREETTIDSYYADKAKRFTDKLKQEAS